MVVNKKKGIYLILFSALCVCVGQLFWKLGSTQNDIYFICVGFILYALGALAMIRAYSYGSVSTLQPLLSISYVLSTILGIVIFSEQITFIRFGAILFIVIGAILIGGSE